MFILARLIVTDCVSGMNIIWIGHIHFDQSHDQKLAGWRSKETTESVEVIITCMQLVPHASVQAASVREPGWRTDFKEFKPVYVLEGPDDFI